MNDPHHTRLVGKKDSPSLEEQKEASLALGAKNTSKDVDMPGTSFGHDTEWRGTPSEDGETSYDTEV